MGSDKQQCPKTDELLELLWRGAYVVRSEQISTKALHNPPPLQRRLGKPHSASNNLSRENLEADFGLTSHWLPTRNPSASLYFLDGSIITFY